MVTCLYCLEFESEPEDLIKDGRCVHCGNRIVYGSEDQYYAILDLQASPGPMARKLVETSYEVYKEIEQKISKTVEGAEEGIEASVAEELPAHFYYNYTEDRGIGKMLAYMGEGDPSDHWDSEEEQIGTLFAATCLSFFENELGMDMPEKFRNHELGHETRNERRFRRKFRDIAMEAREPIYNNFSGTTHGKYSPEHREIKLRKIPPRFVEEVKQSFSGPYHLPYLLEPFLDFIAKTEEDGLISTLNHEMTHAYIDLNTGYEDKPYLDAIDEAASQATGYIREGGWNNEFPNCDHYREGRMPRALLQTLIKCFIRISSEKEGSTEEKISYIREQAVNAIERMQDPDEKIHPINAVISGTDSELEHIYGVLRRLETAEYYAFHAMQLIGMVKRDQDMKNWVHDSAEDSSPYEYNVYEEIDNSYSGPERDFEEPLMSDLVEEMKQVEQQLEDMISRRGQEEQKKELKQIKEDLSDFLDLFRDEEKYFNSFEDREATDLEKKLMVNSNNSGIGAIVYRDTVEEAEEELEERINEYMDIFRHARELNKKILHILENIHEEEGILNQHTKEKEEHQAIKKLAEETQQAYEIFGRTEQHLDKAINILGEAEELLQE